MASFYLIWLSQVILKGSSEYVILRIYVPKNISKKKTLYALQQVAIKNGETQWNFLLGDSAVLVKIDSFFPCQITYKTLWSKVIQEHEVLTSIGLKVCSAPVSYKSIVPTKLTELESKSAGYTAQ